MLLLADLLRHTFVFPSGHRVTHRIDSQATVRQVLALAGTDSHLLPATVDSLGLCIAFDHCTVVADSDKFFWDELRAAETQVPTVFNLGCYYVVLSGGNDQHYCSMYPV